MKKIIDIIPFYKSPRWLTILTAKILLRMFKVDDLQNDIVLYNELRKWVETSGRPTTSNPNYWINKN